MVSWFSIEEPAYFIIQEIFGPNLQYSKKRIPSLNKRISNET